MGDIVSQAFGDNPSLESEIRQWLDVSPSNPFTANLPNLLSSISYHTASLRNEIGALKRKLSSYSADQHTSTVEPLHKKRKLPDHVDPLHDSSANSVAVRSNGTEPQAAAMTALSCIFEMPDLSFSLPARKKYTLEIGIPPQKLKDDKACIRGRNDKSGEIDFTVAFQDIDQIISVPVPEKAQPAAYFVVLPTPSASAAGVESVVWTVPMKWLPPEAYKFPAPHVAGPIAMDADEGCDRYLARVLAKYTSHSVVTPRTEDFASAITQPHLKNDTAYHIKAFRGSKDGFLYLLPRGILFGFRKPLLFFPFSSIESISYSAVLQRTFNLNIVADVAGKAEEYEFGMLDQRDFDGVDTYVKRHGLNDASLAAERKAKVFNVNKPRGGGQEQLADGNAPENAASTGGEESELARAERELQDAEDEEEEDFDPGSGGESDGSGSSDEEDEAEDGYDDDDGNNDDDDL